MDKEQAALQLIQTQLASAVKPIVLWSGGKDSTVLLHLCLRVRKVPVLFLRFAKFHEKHAHAQRIMELWDLEVYDCWPRTVTEYQSGAFFEVLHGYATGHGGVLYLFSGIRARREGETRYLCAIEDLLLRPKAYSQDYPWDLSLHGHKGSDDPELGSLGTIVQPVSQLGTTRLVVPFLDWSNEDIWSYIHKYDLPYDHRRYEEKDESVSPDKYPTCFNCLDTRHIGEVVDCPKYEQPLLNIARPEREHEEFRQAIIGSVKYCEITGEPRRTENADHL